MEALTLAPTMALIRAGWRASMLAPSTHTPPLHGVDDTNGASRKLATLQAALTVTPPSAADALTTRQRAADMHAAHAPAQAVTEALTQASEAPPKESWRR